MNELTRPIAAELLKREPHLADVFDEFDTSEEELIHLWELMGVRHVVVEIPPAGNAHGPLHANVSSTDR